MPSSEQICEFFEFSSEKLDGVWLMRYNIVVAHPSYVGVCQSKCEGREKLMSEVRIRENESLESALRRFKRKTARDGILAEARKREHYEKPSVKRKKKAEAARKRKY